MTTLSGLIETVLVYIFYLILVAPSFIYPSVPIDQSMCDVLLLQLIKRSSGVVTESRGINKRIPLQDFLKKKIKWLNSLPKVTQLMRGTVVLNTNDIKAV